MKVLRKEKAMATQKIAANPRCLAWCWLAVLWLLPWAASGAEETFDVLQIGTRSYTNVTVTTKNSNYVFIVHSRGMENLRVKDLPPDVLEKLGYAAAPPKPDAATNNAASAWTKQTLSKMETPQLKAFEKQFSRRWAPRVIAPVRSLNRQEAWLAFAIVFLVYFGFCYCCRLICLKSEVNAGLLVWIPGFQAIPLFRAAGMSLWWLLPALIPFVNFVVHIVWSIKICLIRGKSPLAMLLLIVPGISLIGFLYLAFSDDIPQPEVAQPTKPIQGQAFALRV